MPQALAMVAHQGGWDEALVFVAPVALLATLVWLATVAAQRRADAEATRAPTDAPRDRRPAP